MTTQRANFRLSQLRRILDPSAVAGVGGKLVQGQTAEDTDKRQPVAVVLGAGAGIGQGVAAKFAAEGYHTVVCRRGSGPNRLLRDEDDAVGKLEAFAQAIRDRGGKATPRFMDGTDPEQVGKMVKEVEENIGPIHFVNYNIGAQVGNRTLEQTSYRIFELGWRLGALGAFAIAKEVAPYMTKRGHGTIIYTSATAAYRGNKEQHAHTAAMGGRMRLTQSLAAELGPKGIHICHVNMDGLINAPDTAGIFMKRADPNGYQNTLDKRKSTNEIIEPVDVANTYYHLHCQPRGIWTLDLDIRPWTTPAWFNS